MQCFHRYLTDILSPVWKVAVVSSLFTTYYEPLVVADIQLGTPHGLYIHFTGRSSVFSSLPSRIQSILSRNSRGLYCFTMDSISYFFSFTQCRICFSRNGLHNTRLEISHLVRLTGSFFFRIEASFDKQ